MEKRCYSITVSYSLLLVFLLDKGSAKSDTVEANLRGSVILPCSTRGYEKDVFWRCNTVKTVYDIIDGKEDFHDQDATYKDRVEGFPSKFTEGNYSIRLVNVTHRDAGIYSCQIPNTNTVHVELRVKVPESPMRVRHQSLQRNGVDIRSDNLLWLTAAVLRLLFLTI